MAYTITISDGNGTHTISSPDQDSCELIVKSYIYVLLREDDFSGLDADQAPKAEALLSDLEFHLRGTLNPFDLDEIVERLVTDACWLTGPVGHPSFQISRGGAQ